MLITTHKYHTCYLQYCMHFAWGYHMIVSLVFAQVLLVFVAVAMFNSHIGFDMHHFNIHVQLHLRIRSAHMYIREVAKTRWPKLWGIKIRLFARQFKLLCCTFNWFVGVQYWNFWLCQLYFCTWIKKTILKTDLSNDL